MTDVTVAQGTTKHFIEVLDPIAVLDTGRFEAMQRIASIMARSTLTPEHLRTVAVTDDEGNPVYENGKRVMEHLSYEAVFANCFRIVNQAIRWGLDPFPVAECTSVVRGRLCYEGKLVAGVLDAKLGIELDYKWNDAKGEAFGIVVSGRTQKRGDLKSVSGTVGLWKTTRKGSPWLNPGNHPRQLAYRGTREWARLYKPALMLGIITEDEMDEIRGRSIAPVQHALGKPAEAPVFTSMKHSEPWRPENDAAAKLEATNEEARRAAADAARIEQEAGGPLDPDSPGLEGVDPFKVHGNIGSIQEAGPVDENPTPEGSSEFVPPSPPLTATTAPPTAEATSSALSPNKEPSTDPSATTTSVAPAATTAPPEPTDDASYQAHCVAWVAECEDRKDALATWTSERKLRRELNLTAAAVDACKLLVERAFPKEG